jgi:hypothetical protein
MVAIKRRQDILATKIYSVRDNLTRGNGKLGGLMIELKVVKGDL